MIIALSQEHILQIQGSLLGSANGHNKLTEGYLVEHRYYSSEHIPTIVHDIYAMWNANCLHEYTGGVLKQSTIDGAE